MPFNALALKLMQYNKHKKQKGLSRREIFDNTDLG
jgi:hypothetical protein